jgi:hypothetical protein
MKTIEEVINRLTEIIDQSKKQNSPLGYFAVLYRKVTIRVRDGILNQEFADNPRMEKLDVLFAQRYIRAYDQWAAGKTPTQSWEIAFSAGERKKPLIIQHLLLGINAHINLDLGIAAVETVASEPLDTLKTDFDAINNILAEMVDDVQDRIGKVSPLFGMLDPLAGRSDEYLANFSINLARDGAWQFAAELYGEGAAIKEKRIQDRDAVIAAIAGYLASPKSKWIKAIIKVIRWFETKNVSRVIDFLSAD